MIKNPTAIFLYSTIHELERYSTLFNIKSISTSKIRKQDPLYLINLDNLIKKDQYGKLKDFVSNCDLITYYVVNDWIIPEIEKDNYNKKILKKITDIKDRNKIKEFYRYDKHTNYMVLRKDIKGLSESDKNFIFQVINKTGYNNLNRFFMRVSKNAGMFYLSEPNNFYELKKSINQIKKHSKAIELLNFPEERSFLYKGTLNRIDYGISIVDTKRTIIYANNQRRYQFGNDILGKKCFKVFPHFKENIKNMCPNCPMQEVIDSISGKKTERCEVHKLENKNGDVYFISETASRLIIRNENNKLTKLGINIVREITPRVLSDIYQKLLLQLNSRREVITMLKYALIGGKEEDFKNDFKRYFFNQNKKIKKLFDESIKKICFYKSDNNILTCRLKSFRFGRFRYYRKVIDLFNPDCNIKSDSKLSSSDIYQIHEAYDQFGRMDKNRINENEKLIGEYFDLKSFEKIGFRRLSENKKGEITHTHIRSINEDILQKDKKILLFLEKLGLIQKNKKGKYEKINWVDIDLISSTQEIGLISLDWKGSDFNQKKFDKEYRRILFEFLTLSSHSLQRVFDNEYYNLTQDLTRILVEQYDNINKMYYDFCKELCRKMQALKCEIYLLKPNNKLHRRYLYYESLKQKETEKANEELKREQELEKNIIGNSLKIILDNIKEAESPYKLPIQQRCINIMNYEKYNEFYKKNFGDNIFENKRFHDEYKATEEKYILNCYLKKIKFDNPDNLPFRFSEYINNRDNIKIQNCIIAPIIYKGKPLGVLRLTNNLYEGRIFFPLIEQKILFTIAEQLAVKINNEYLYKREKGTLNIFSELTKILLHDEMKMEYCEIEEDDTTEEIKKLVLNKLEDVIEPDSIFYWVIKEDDETGKTLSLVYPDEKKIESLNNDQKEIFIEINRIYLDKPNNFKHISILKGIINSKTVEDKEKMVNLFDSTNHKILCRGIRINKDLYSILFMEKKSYFEKVDFNAFDTTTQQIEAIRTIRSLKNISEETMQNIAHQIISPVKGIISHTNQLSRSLLPKDDPNYFHFRDNSHRNQKIDFLNTHAEHIGFIANSYQTFIYLNTGKKLILKKKIMDLSSILIKIVAIYQPIALINKNINIHVDVKRNDYIPFIGDESMMVHIITVLVDNAIKYSNNKTNINLYLKTTINKLIIKISNHGLVIPNKHKKKIFNKYFRTDGAKNRFKNGSGLGLFIVDKLCGILKGNCIVEKSNISEGTIFRVTLPNNVKKEEL